MNSKAFNLYRSRVDLVTKKLAKIATGTVFDGIIMKRLTDGNFAYLHDSLDNKREFYGILDWFKRALFVEVTLILSLMFLFSFSYFGFGSHTITLGFMTLASLGINFAMISMRFLQMKNEIEIIAEMKDTKKAIYDAIRIAFNTRPDLINVITEGNDNKEMVKLLGKSYYYFSSNTVIFGVNEFLDYYTVLKKIEDMVCNGIESNYDNFSSLMSGNEYCDLTDDEKSAPDTHNSSFSNNKQTKERFSEKSVDHRISHMPESEIEELSSPLDSSYKNSASESLEYAKGLGVFGVAGLGAMNLREHADKLEEPVFSIDPEDAENFNIATDDEVVHAVHVSDQSSCNKDLTHESVDDLSKPSDLDSVGESSDDQVQGVTSNIEELDGDIETQGRAESTGESSETESVSLQSEDDTNAFDDAHSSNSNHDEDIDHLIDGLEGNDVDFSTISSEVLEDEDNQFDDYITEDDEDDDDDDSTTRGSSEDLNSY